MTAPTIRSSMWIRRRTGSSSARPFRPLTLQDRTSCTPTWTAILATRPRAKFPFAPRAMAACRKMAATTRMSGRATFPSTSCPGSYNPPSGIIATANGRITPDEYPYSISTGWEAPWRTARIYRVLESGKKFSAADMLALQMDIYSEADRYFAERFVYGVDHASTASARTKQAAELMRGWDGRMTADSAAPPLRFRLAPNWHACCSNPNWAVRPRIPNKPRPR